MLILKVLEMASPTNVVKKRRAIRKAAAGKRRKALMHNKGSVAPNLPLTMPNANEIKQKKAVTKA